MLVDGVFSGGGMKGFAYVGALQALRERHIAFERVAGTSAGAILAAFLAAGYTADELEAIFDELQLHSLLDQPKRRFHMPILKWLNLYKHYGMYKGERLEQWFAQKLAAKGVHTFGDLPKDALKLVASDLTNGKIVVLPDDLARYQIDSATFPVARALRMSCSLPFFFQPVQLRQAVIVDGGVLSNFPLWIFDNGSKKRPVLGIKLSSASSELPPRRIDNALQLYEALFASMQKAHDQRYIERKHEKNIIFISVEKFSTTDFQLNAETKQQLIAIGKERTTQFLNSWSPVW